MEANGQQLLASLDAAEANGYRALAEADVAEATGYINTAQYDLELATRFREEGRIMLIDFQSILRETAQYGHSEVSPFQSP